MTADSSFETTNKPSPVKSSPENGYGIGAFEKEQTNGNFFRETHASSLLPSEQVLRREADRHSISMSVESANKLIENGAIPALSLENIQKQWSRHEGEGTLKSIRGVVDSILLQLIIESGTQSFTGDAATQKTKESEFVRGGDGPGGIGDHNLATGDRLQRDADGKETLTTPNGDKIVVNADSSYRVTGNLKSSTGNNEHNERTVIFEDGTIAKFGRDGIHQVRRKDLSISFISPEPHKNYLPI